jgi:hypothetical protein
MAFTVIETDDDLTATQSRFAAPTTSTTLRWLYTADPESYDVCVVKIVEQSGDLAKCAFVGASAALVMQGGAERTETFDLSDLRQAWRHLPSTIDASAEGGDYALLCVNSTWRQTHASWIPYFGKYPWGEEMATLRARMKLEAAASGRQAAGVTR